MSFSNKSFHQLVISSTSHFFKMSFLQNVISSKCHFFKMSFLQNVISSKCHFFKMSFLQNVISSKCHFVSRKIPPWVPFLHWVKHLVAPCDVLNWPNAKCNNDEMLSWFNGVAPQKTNLAFHILHFFLKESKTAKLGPRKPYVWERLSTVDLLAQTCLELLLCISKTFLRSLSKTS
jgi:hypothetical protein